MKAILYKMKYYPYRDNVSTPYNPLQLLALIKKTYLVQNLDQYKFAKVNEKECSIYSFSQNSSSKKKWYEWINNRIDVVSDVCVTQQHQVLRYHVRDEYNKKLEDMNYKEKRDTQEDAEERYLS